MAGSLALYHDIGGSDTAPGSTLDLDALGPPNMRFRADDFGTIDTNNPIPIPGAGTNYSFWKQIYLACSVAPSTKIDNIKMYTDGGDFGTGVTLNVSTTLPPHANADQASYEVATGVVGTSGSLVTDNHALVTAVTDVFGYTSASPYTVTITEASNQIDALNEMTDYIILQMDVISTASAGSLTAETITFQYDEI